MKKPKKITIYAIMLALCLVLSYLESCVPYFFAVPGMKLGLTNIVIVVALYKLGFKEAFVINIMRILLVFLLFSNVYSFFYSLAGAVVSFVVMILLKKSGKFSMITVSICGGVFHNAAQVVVAMLVFNTLALGYYFVALWFAGIVAGLFVGITSAEIVKRLPDISHFS